MRSGFGFVIKKAEQGGDINCIFRTNKRVINVSSVHLWGDTVNSLRVRPYQHRGTLSVHKFLSEQSGTDDCITARGLKEN